MRLGQEKINITDKLDFFARQVVEGFLTGMHKSPYHGFSVEFAEHRLYNNGDPVKNVDWKLFARSNKLFVKKFEEETNLRSYLLLDTSSSMFYPVNKESNKLSFSLYSAACLMYLFQKQRDGFSLSFFSDKLDFFTDAKSTKLHYNRLLSEIDKKLNIKHIEQERKTDFSDVISDLIEQIPERSLVIIFSDMINFDQSYSRKIFEALQHLRYRKHEVILFHVQDRETEQLFNFSNKPHKFIDLENKSEINLNPMAYQDTYRKLYYSFKKELELNCNKYSIDYIPSLIEDGFSKVLLSYLTKRSKII